MSKTIGTRKMRLSQDGYISEIIHGRATGLYHYIITKGDSPEIVAWGQENTLEGARKSVENFIEHDKNRKRAAG